MHLTTDNVRVKKYFYALRPILAARWNLDRHSAPPMLFSELVSAELPQSLHAEINRLLEQKGNISELGMSPRISAFDEYIEQNLEELKKRADELEKEEERDWEPLYACFRRLLQQA